MSQNHLEELNHIQNLDKLAGNFFLAGLIVSRLKDIPMGYFSFYLSAFAFTAYALAYTIQLYTSNYYDKDLENTFDFQFLFQLQSLCGAIASWTLLINPSLWMPCLVLFLASNMLWYWAECQRFKTPTQYPAMPSNPQNYLQFCAYMNLATAIFVVAGLLTTLGISGVPWLTIATLLNYLATITAFYHLCSPDRKHSVCYHC